METNNKKWHLYKTSAFLALLKHIFWTLWTILSVVAIIVTIILYLNKKVLNCVFIQATTILGWIYTVQQSESEETPTRVCNGWLQQDSNAESLNLYMKPLSQTTKCSILGSNQHQILDYLYHCKICCCRKILRQMGVNV